jgi:N-dimethylarginine dimethylaminohydrolase
MNNSQVTHLRPGAQVRRKEPFETRSTVTSREIYIVERVERPVEQNGDWTVHAGGFAFKAWEIERVRYVE